MSRGRYPRSFDWGTLLGIEPGTYVSYDYEWEGDEEGSFDRDLLDPTVTLHGDLPSGGSEPLLRFIAETSADGLLIIDADTRATLWEFPNYDAFDWNDVVANDAFSRFETDVTTMLAVTPDGTAIVPDGVPLWGRLELVEMNDGVIVIADTGDQVEGFLTRDGLTFESVSVPDTLTPPVYDPASGYLYTPYVDTWYGPGFHWISPDGVTWQPLDTIPSDESPTVSMLLRMEGAWLLMRPVDNGRIDHYVSRDGEVWEVFHVDAMVSLGGFPVASSDWIMVFDGDSYWVGQATITGG